MEGAGSVDICVTIENPKAVGDSKGEWFEVYNITTETIDLMGWTVLDDDRAMDEEGFTISTSLTIQAGAYLLFANNSYASTNGGLPVPDYAYDATAYLLGNGSDGIVLKCVDTLIDAVIWDGGTTFPDPTGASMYLSVDHLNATDNDAGANRSVSTVTYGDGDIGTPGAVNAGFSVDMNTLKGMSVYPNPVNGAHFTISFVGEVQRLITMYDVLGQKIYEQVTDASTVNVNRNLKAGMYILEVKENGVFVSQKVIVN